MTAADSLAADLPEMQQGARQSGGTLTRGSIPRHLVTMTVPSIAGVLAIMASSILDTYFAGLLGTNAQAAIAFTVPVAMIVSSLGLGLSIGTSALVARTLGSGRHVIVPVLAFHSFSLTLSAVGLAALAGWLFLTPVFRGLGASPEMMPYIRDYMMLWYPGAVMMVAMMVAGGVLRADGDTLTPSIALGIAGIVKVVSGYVMVVQLGWGMFGAGASTFVSFAISAVLPIAVMIRRGRITWPRWLLRGALTSWRRILTIGLPSAVTNMLVPIANAVIVKLLAPLGAATVAGFGVATRIEALALIVPMALSGVVGPFVGQNFGARRRDRVADALRMTMAFTLVFSLVCALLLAIFAMPSALLFSADADVAGRAAQFLLIVPVTYGVFGIVMLVAAAYNGMGDPRPNMLLYGIKTIGVLIPGCWIGLKLGGYTGVLIAIAAANVISGGLAWLLARRITAPAPRQLVAAE